MNTHAEYRRHSYKAVDPPAQNAEQPVSELSHHRDRSLATAITAPAAGSQGIAWVRPTDLASYAGPLVGRGIDLQSELIRRARRTPATTARAFQRRDPEIASPSSPSTRKEGLQL